MSKSSKKALALAVLCAVSSINMVSHVSAEEVSETESQQVANVETGSREEVQSHQLAGIIVEGDKDVLIGGFAKRKSEVGILGNMDVKKTPFTKVNLTEKAINSFATPGESLSSALLNIPSIKSASSTMYNDVNIRGTRVNGYQFYINGVPGLLTQTNIPTNFIGNIEVTSGPAMSFTGTTTQETAGGMVNLISKRAEDDNITKYTQTFSGRGNFGEYIDIGRRFGKSKEWGLRINAQNLSGETAIPGEKLTARNLFLNLDHKDDNSSTNLLAGYRYVKHNNGVRWFQYGDSVTKLPDAPNSKNNYSFAGQRMEYDTWLATLNHEQKLSDDWSVFFTGGYSRYDLYTNYNAKSSAYLVTNNNGDFIAQSWSKTFPVTSYYGQIGIKGVVNTGEVKHNIALAADKSWYNNGSGIASVNFNNSVMGNLYNKTHIIGEGLPAKNTGGFTSKSQYWGISLADTLEYGKAQLTLGIHSHHANTTSYDAKTGEVTSDTQKSDATSPTYAIVYSPNDNVSFYASHSESFNKGTLVPESRNGHYFDNANSMLEPTKTKQNEIGIKYENKGLLTTLSAFDITQANTMEEQLSNGDWHYSTDGETEYKGLELTVNGKIADKWNAMGGIMYLDAKINNATNKNLNGTRVNGVSKWNGVAALEYNADEKFSILGRALYNGSSKIKNEKLDVPSYLTFDIGMKYKTKLSNTPVTLTAMCYNLTGEDYWIASGNTTILSNPRTFMLTAEFDL